MQTDEEQKVLESLDFDSDRPCELSMHKTGGPARWLLTFITKFPCGCDSASASAACEDCWSRLRRHGAQCLSCRRNLGDVFNIVTGVTRL